MTAGAGKARELVSAATFMDRPREAKSLDGMAAWTVWGALTGSGELEEPNTVLVTRTPSACSALRGPALGPALVGLAPGGAGAVLFGRAFARDHYQVSPHDPLTDAAVALALIATAAAACAIPARSASRIDPAVALRSE